MRTEIYIENQRLDLTEDVDTDFTYTIDDINDFGAKNTSYSKTIRIAGNGNNNAIFGNIFDLNNANFSSEDAPNVGVNYNASKNAQCRIFIDGIQIFKGALRILEIIQEGSALFYECSVVGDLGGFMSALGNKKLEELDFSAYNTAWNFTNITNSWDNINGSGVYYPLIDYGKVSSLVNTREKKDFDYKAFRPALFVKEMLNKIVNDSEYTWTFPLLDTALFNRLVIPNNQRIVNRLSNNLFTGNFTAGTYTASPFPPLTVITSGLFTGTNPLTYTGSTISTNISSRLNIQFKAPLPTAVTVTLNRAGSPIKTINLYVNSGTTTYSLDLSLENIILLNGQQLSILISSNVTQYQVTSGGYFNLTSSVSTEIPVLYGEQLEINYCIPKGIFQRDFFISICKLFNLYVYDDPFDEKKLIIKPYIDFYGSTIQDWTNKVDRESTWSIKPMSEVKARYYQFKYKQDNDYYAENYRKKFNEGYGDFIFDTEFDFVKDTDSEEVIFAGTTLYNLVGTDKIYSAIYKLSSSATTEDPMDSVIRILQAKKITGLLSYNIQNNFANVGTSLTSYGYAGHLDDPYAPTNDLCFGSPKEIYFTTSTYPTTNLFNAYYSEYMAEITDKDSKLLSCNVLLNSFDIQSLDFSKFVYIDNVLYRLNIVDSYNPINYTTTKIELLKVIDK
jgi:hypothetical protein